MSVVIAIDGTAGCGKGTLARKLARHYSFAHLDSGALYRLVALGVLDSGGDPSNPEEAVRSARNIDTAAISDPRLRSVDVGEAASVVAAIPEVRSAILQFQQDFAAHPPGGSPGAVIDGRDIGTVVCPNATVKLFVDALPAVRAQRRWLELQNRPKEGGEAVPPVDVSEVEAEILARDERDRSRKVAPLKPAADSILLDTSDLDIEATFAKALELVNPRIEKALAARPRG
jgi:cytidylate kinase